METGRRDGQNEVTLTALVRYPVKSMKGERLTEARLTTYGLEGDRTRYMEIQPDGSQLTARKLPGLLGYRAIWVTERVTVEAPDGLRYIWGEPALRERLEQESGRTLILRTLDATREPLMAVDDAPLLVVSAASVRELERQWGQPLDWRRFRPNLVLSDEGLRPFEEEDWLGQTLQIGEARIRLEKRCERCMMITLEPDSQLRDPSLLRLVAREREACFGVYASVLVPGTVRIGDVVTGWGAGAERVEQ
ncbi:hypothetical protein J31TS4_39030 [Paenibacillus sp. J31TS4]|uniref:MOSC domain-containing protein n=1 Tax=Paenibacillus sp. J31TS4 TaxID=2807195 RepID=UPI001B246D22|nr:MOSC domain-containing protein [Paenibacillus sp. J31TS4]GIP40623.1 hypothetical protein J31TS4_39030 [Paenibacillus sp. J31TS4]